MINLKTLRAALTAALLLLLAFSQHVQAQTHTPKYNVSMTPNSGGYYEYLPQGYDPNGSTKHPLIVFIHGVYEKGNGGTSDLLDIVKFGLPKKIKYGSFPSSFTVNGKTEKFIVISPQFKSSPTSFDINAVITYVLSKYKVNPNKVYLTGLSMGGGATWNFGSNTLYNNRIAAMVPICGSVSYTTEKAENIARSGIKVWATHNQFDSDVSSSKTVNWVTKINAANPVTKAKMSIWARSGHDAWTRTYDATYKEDGKNIFEWMLQFEKGTTPPITNKPPVANAGSDKSIQLPATSVTLTGSGTDTDGSISKYSWTKVSGPSGAVITNASSSAATVTALVAGTYVFRLTVSDNGGVSASDDVSVIVSNPSNPLTGTNPPGKLKVVNVNIYGGSNSFANAAWNNWNVSSSLTSGALKYSDATVSTITAALSKSEGVNDNGSGYGPGMAPAEVLRYTSNATTARTLTLSGLSASKKYALEVYGSRDNYSGNNSVYSVGSKSQTVATYKNLANRAVFQNLVPNSSGQVVVNISGAQEYNYINGFTLTEVKGMNVNLYGGDNSYSNTAWNNWNVASSLSSGALKYSDASVSTVVAALSKSEGVNDNGSSYGSGMAPAEVLRFASNATTSRTLTFTGLSASKAYSLELYSSRDNYTGNVTSFTINGVVQNVSTYGNKSSKAIFEDLVPSSSGTIVVSIANTQSYNYLNGFVLTEGVAAATNGATTTAPGGGSTDVSEGTFTVSPNPFTDKFALKITNTLTGTVKIAIRDAGGVIKKTFRLNKATTGTMQTYLSAGDLPVGQYNMEVIIGSWIHSIPVQKN